MKKIKTALISVSDKRNLKFDQASRMLTSTGKFEWNQTLPENENVFDPLNVQIQIRKNVIVKSC